MAPGVFSPGVGNGIFPVAAACEIELNTVKPNIEGRPAAMLVFDPVEELRTIGAGLV